MSGNKKCAPFWAEKKKTKMQYGGPQISGEPSGQQIAGNVLQGIGGMVSLIPGWGTAVGMGLSAVGGIVGATAAPKMTVPVNYNTGPYGYVMGGDLSPLANNSYQVKASNPSKTDSVDVGKFKLDNKEVVVNNAVFSDSITNPFTNNSFAKDAATVQKALGKFEKSKSKSGDYELQDSKHLNNNTQIMFQNQEKLARLMGLRNEDGTPIQTSNKGMKRGGNKMSMQFGGPPITDLGGPPITDPNYWMTYQNDLSDRSFDSVYGNLKPQLSDSTLILTSKTPTNYAGDPSESSAGGRKMFTDYPIQKVPVLGSPTYIDPNIIGPQKSDFIPHIPQNMPSMVGLSSPVNRSNVFKSPQTLNVDPSNSDVDPSNSGTLVQGESMEQRIKRLMEQQHPYGNAATVIGGGVSALSNIVNQPFYVNYGNVGNDEIRLQNQALRRISEGEKSALQSVTNSSRSAMAELENRSLQSRNANLRNIVAGESEAKGKIFGQFAGLEANARMQAGARRTGIEQVNLQRAMQQDQTNTQEYDTMMKENMKSLMNFRELALEKQDVMNQVRRDEILKGLLQTKDFKWDENSNEVIMKLLYPNLSGNTPSSSTSNTSMINWLNNFAKRKRLTTD